jgi:predicted RNA binding protein YcfA (HicA-like mRNA interferase family)
LPELRVLSGREICRILEEFGFIQERVRGSHIIMKRSTANSTTSVPVPNHREVAVGTLRSIIRQSGLTTEPFEVRR